MAFQLRRPPQPAPAAPKPASPKLSPNLGPTKPLGLPPLSPPRSNSNSKNNSTQNSPRQTPRAAPASPKLVPLKPLSLSKLSSQQQQNSPPGSPRAPKAVSVQSPKLAQNNAPSSPRVTRTSPAPAKMSACAPGDQILFSPHKVGAFQTRNRIWMAPLTRLRNSEDDMPGPDALTYYTQRAGAGVIISEAVHISPQGKGYHGSPGCYTPDQIAAWKQITDAVHEKGGAIVVQYWHTGRVSHPSVQPYGMRPVAPSAVDHIDVRTTIKAEGGGITRAKSPCPQELSPEGIRQVVRDFGFAAKCAKEAGFDGLELHAAHGYLIHQFLGTNSNLRQDRYGGSLENRVRFCLEAVDAAIAAWGADRIGVRLSPVGSYQGTQVEPVEGDPNQQETDLECSLYLIQQLAKRNIAYIHFSEMEWAGNKGLPDRFRREVRETFKGTIVCAGGYTPDSAASRLHEGVADAVAFGRHWISTPDLVERFRKGLPLNEPGVLSYYGGDARGYIDYPTWEELLADDEEEEYELAQGIARAQIKGEEEWVDEDEE